MRPTFNYKRYNPTYNLTPHRFPIFLVNKESFVVKDIGSRHLSRQLSQPSKNFMILLLTCTLDSFAHISGSIKMFIDQI